MDRKKKKKAAIQILTRRKGVKSTLCLCGFFFFSNFVPRKNILFSQTLYLLVGNIRFSDSETASLTQPTNAGTMSDSSRLPSFRVPSYSTITSSCCWPVSSYRPRTSRLSQQWNSGASFRCFFCFFLAKIEFLFFTETEAKTAQTSKREKQTVFPFTAATFYEVCCWLTL